MDFSSYPPAIALWCGVAIDMTCGYPLNLCKNWRDYMPSAMVEDGAWFSEEFRLRPLSEIMREFQFLSYRQFIADQEATALATGTEPPSFVEGVFRWLFLTNSTTLADLTHPDAIVALIVLVMLIRLIKIIVLPWFSSLGRRAARETHGPDWEKSNEVRIVKFGEYVFRLVFHTAIAIFGVCYFWDKEWWKPGGTPSLWTNYPQHKNVEPGMIWYYLIQSAYNLEALLSLLELSFVIRVNWPGTTKEDGVKTSTTASTSSAAETPRREFGYGLPIPSIYVGWSSTARGDFREMFIHHIVTNLLVIGSSFFRLTRCGSMVFLVHDISDVPVDLSKLANFLKWKVTTVVCFITMVIVWLVTRLGVLPFVIFRSVLKEGWMVCSSGVLDPQIYVSFHQIFNLLLGSLILLHLAWFAMFMKMFYVLVRKGETHDLSEHKKGEVVQNGRRKQD